MRTNKFFAGVMLLTVAASMVLTSCQKGVQSKTQTTTVTNQQNQSGFASMLSIANAEDVKQLAIALDPSLLSTVAPSGSCPPVVTYDNPPGVYPRTVTIDYGVGCTNADGVTRSGKIITYYSGDLADTGTFFKTTYDNYFINGVHIEGIGKWEHNKRKNKTDPQNIFRQTLKNRKVTQVNGDYIIYNGEKRVVKNDTIPVYIAFPAGGIFRVTGTISGTELKGGVSYQWSDQMTAANPLIYNFCQFPVKGKEHVDFTGNPNATTWDIDYGSGTCDTDATLSVDSGPFNPVTLPLSF